MKHEKRIVRKKTTKRALGMSVMSLVLCFAMLVGTTFAWFTDSVTSENNIIKSGILRISMEWANGTEDPASASWMDASTGAIFNNDKWEPGYTEVRHIRIMNERDGKKSNLALQYKLAIVPTGTPSELAEVIDVYSVAPTADSDLQNMAMQIETRADMSKLTRLGTLQDILDKNGAIDISGIMLPEDEVNSLTIALKMQEEAGNKYQDLEIGSNFRIVLTATQYTYESDSFDNQYDAGAMPAEPEPELSGTWFDCDAAEAEPTAVKSIAFTKTAPTEGSYDVTWTAPKNTTAYYNKNTCVLTYVLNKGDRLVFDDATMLKFGDSIIPGLGASEEDVLAYYNLIAAEEELPTFDTYAALAASEYAEFIPELFEGLSYSKCFSGISSVSGLGLWDVSAVTDFSGVFRNASKLTALDLSGWDTSNAVTMEEMFYICTSISALDLSSFNTAKVRDMSNMFGRCSSLASLNISSFNTAEVTDMRSMFSECKALISLDVSKFDTAKVRDMGSMFSQCMALSALDLSSFNTAAVTDMHKMFAACSKLESITGLTGFNTAKVRDMSYMFWQCEVLTALDLSSFNTAAVTEMTAMFRECKSLAMITGLAGFNTAAVTSMHQMFAQCGKLSNASLGDVAGWSTAKVTDMGAVFYGCVQATKLDLSGWNTSCVTNMGFMFSSCTSLAEIDISGFDTSEVTNMSYMFEMGTTGTAPLEHIYIGTGWSTASVEDSELMFLGCSKLPNFNSANVTDKTYAKPTTAGGYLETKT